MRRETGFTLIELSIVLVIIGLLVGGVLVARDLVNKAAERAQISQIEKFNHAVNTFYGKYGALPGDMPAVVANTFGFAPRGPLHGQGDGNGAIEGNGINNPSTWSGADQAAGETLMFWVDLSQAGLIQGGFNSASSIANVSNITGTTIGQYYPQAPLGYANYVLVLGGTGGGDGYMNFSLAGPNFFVVEAVTTLGFTAGAHGSDIASYGITVQQAYDIDSKIDDGFPTSGRVLAIILSQAATWVDNSGPPNNSHVPNNSAYCYNNGAVDGVPMQYSMSYASQTTCTLGFQFQ